VTILVCGELNGWFDLFSIIDCDGTPSDEKILERLNENPWILEVLPISVTTE